MADTSESRGWLGFVHPLGDGVIISEAVVKLVRSGPALETPELRRAMLVAHRLADVNPKRKGFLDEGSVLQGKRTRLTALPPLPRPLPSLLLPLPLCPPLPLSNDPKRLSLLRHASMLCV